MSLTKDDIKDITPYVEKYVKRYLGHGDSKVVENITSSLSKGYDRRKIREKLIGAISESDAAKIAEKVYAAAEDIREANKHKPRKRRSRSREHDASKKSKKRRNSPSKEPKERENGSQSGSDDGSDDLSDQPMVPAQKIREMMADAQKAIQQRKQQLNLPQQAAPKPMTFLDDRAKRAVELQARIQATMNNPALASLFPIEQPVPKEEILPDHIMIDKEGRPINPLTGKILELIPARMPTLKANIRAVKQKEQMKKKTIIPSSKDSQKKETKRDDTAQFIDNRVQVKGALRQKRTLQFNQKGKFEEMGNRMRAKAKLELLQMEIAQTAKKTGIASESRLAMMQPIRVEKDDAIPDIEWWDQIVLEHYDYSIVELPDFSAERYLTLINHLVQHPIQVRPPSDPSKPVVLPVMLTKKERKKLRRQSRSEALKEKQERIRLGLLPPPEPKVKISNLMRVLGTEAVQDPTKVEAYVRNQMAKRKKVHEDANASRKLTVEQRREKKKRKTMEDMSTGVHVAVYRVKDLHDPAKKFKIEANCNQLHMSGIVTLCKDINVVVVEGGPKQQRKFKRLMLQRIKWSVRSAKDEVGDDDDDKEDRDVNKCKLVWEGTAKSRAFSFIKFKVCPTVHFAREHFKQHNVEHYWDIAQNEAVLETSDE